MAIVKMKHLRLIGMKAEQEELLRALQHLGCVEVSEQPLPQGEDMPALERPDADALARAREDRAALDGALNTLKHYAPAKGGLFQPRPTVDEDAFFARSAYDESCALARDLLDRDRARAALLSEQQKLLSQQQALAPWSGIDLPLETAGTREVGVLFAAVAKTTDLTVLAGDLQAASELTELFPAGQDRELRYFVLFYHRSAEEDAVAVLKSHGYTRTALKGWTGTAAQCLRALDDQLAALREQTSLAEAELAAFAPLRPALRQALDRADQEIRREEARLRLLDSQTAFCLEGWIPAEAEPELSKTLEGRACAYELADPAPEEYPEVPVKLKNNRFTRPLNMVTEMYSLPAYDGVDPNPLMAPFFILFYGIMMADMGYGLLMFLGGLFMLKKMKPKGTMSHFAGLLLLCGASTFVMGAVTGGFFGDFIPQLIRIFDPESTFALPALFTPLDDTLMILIGAMCLGFIQILAGMAISLVEKCKRGEFMDAVWEEITWYVVFAGAALAVLGVTPLVLALGGAMILGGAVWGARSATGVTGKVIGTFTGIFGSLYNHVTGYFGDILSYSRLMALMLAGSVIAQVFNTLGAIPGNVFIFIIISFAGNALNFALNLLGCYVHDLRLQCLEYFGKFYKDGGRPFRPLSVQTKYVDVVQE